MKKGLILVTTALIIPIFCKAQGSYIVDDKDNLFLGFSGGLGIHGIANQNNYGFQEMDYKAPFGIAAGITFGKEWSRKHRLEVSIQASRTNQKYFSEGVGRHEKSITLHFLEFPLVNKRTLYRMKDTNGGEYSFHIGAGMSTAFRTYAAIQWTTNDEEQTMYKFLTQSGNDNTEKLSELIPNQGDPDYNEVFQNLDIAGLATVGVLYKPSLRWMLEMEARGQYGFLDLNAEDWRLPNRQGEYAASRNYSLALRLSIYYTIWE